MILLLIKIIYNDHNANIIYSNKDILIDNIDIINNTIHGNIIESEGGSINIYGETNIYNNIATGSNANIIKSISDIFMKIQI